MQELSCQNLISAGTLVWWNTHQNVINIIIISIMLVWAGTENGRKYNPQKSIIYEFG